MKIFTNDRYQPYTYFSLFILILIGIEYYYGWVIPKTDKVTNLANILITSTSIFVGFLGVGLTLIYQSQNNKDIAMLKSNPGFYKLLISYFRQSLTISIFAIIISVIMALEIITNIYTFSIFISTHVLVVLLNYRVIKFLFRIIES